jgi:hypothetical protein
LRADEKRRPRLNTGKGEEKEEELVIRFFVLGQNSNLTFEVHRLHTFTGLGRTTVGNGLTIRWFPYQRTVPNDDRPLSLSSTLSAVRTRCVYVCPDFP